jgi:MarR family transcriptional regulator, organic hydroperoxide resistance regulator
MGIPEFADKLNRLIPSILREFLKRNTNELSKGKITLHQFLVLCFLEEKGESRMTDLARFFRVSTAAATGIVNRLVKCSYLTRVFDPGDRRIIKVRLTAKGCAIVEKINRQRRDMVVSVFGRLTEAERQEYLKILTRIHDMLTEDEETVKP